MSIIEKAKETMTAKERVARTFAFEKTDRVTIGYEANSVIHKKFCAALGIPESDRLAFLKALGVDYIGVGAPYIGPEIFPEVPNRYRNRENGIIMRYVENNFGGYWDYCDFPLKDADDEQIYNYPCTSADDYDYDAAAREIDYRIENGFAVHLGNGGFGDILNSTGMLMGVEDALVNIATEHEPTLAMLDKRIDREIEVTRRILERNPGKIDFIWMGEDLGTQYTPIISRDTYNAVLRPRHQKYIDLAKAYGLPVMIHTCGSSSWVYEDLIAMGMNGVDTLQPEAANMSPQYLKEHFGGRLTFRGCISTAGALAYGTAEQTEQVCRETLACFRECRGYHFAPTHMIQDNTPVENVIAMYNAAHRFGVY